MPIIDFISNKRGKSLLYDGFLFKRNKTKPDITYYKCSQINCLTRMALSSDCNFVITPKPEHCHEPPRQKIEEAQFREKVLTSVENTPTKKTKRYLRYRTTSFHVGLYPNSSHYKTFYKQTTDENSTPRSQRYSGWENRRGLGDNFSWRAVFVVPGLASRSCYFSY